VNHLLILPILIPMLGASASLFVEQRRYGPRVQRGVSWVSMVLLAAVVIALFVRAADGQILVYLLGDWPARIGIVLMGDRLSAWMLLTNLILGSACLLHACAGWDRRAPHFHALFQFQLMGVNGACLTGDIFNLFVFFEVMLIASYGLLLSGGRGLQMRVGLHYVVFNVCASTLFLMALGLLFGVFGTLNMAELSQCIADLPAQDVPLAKATLGLLLLVFCSKAALLPLYLWLPETYLHAPAAVAAVFAIMTKVGLYAMLRVSSLWFGAGAGQMRGFSRHALLWLGIATLLMAAFGVMAAARLRVMVSYLVVLSAATLFIAFSLDDAGALGAGLYYLPHSCVVAAALFLISDLIRRRGSASDRKDVMAPLSERAVPGTMFMIAAVAVAGLPPLSGFLAKAALLQHVPDGLVGPVWGAVLGSSVLVVIGLTRAGVRLFWRVPAAVEAAPELQPCRSAHVRPLETAAIAVLLSVLVAMTVAAGPLMHYTNAAAAQLREPGMYVDQVRATTPQRRQP